MWLVRINATTKSQHGWRLKCKAASLLTPPCPSAARAELAMQLALHPLCPMAAWWRHCPLVQPEDKGQARLRWWQGATQADVSKTVVRGWSCISKQRLSSECWWVLEVDGPGASLRGDGRMMGKVSGWVLDRQASHHARAFPDTGSEKHPSGRLCLRLYKVSLFCGSLGSY